MYWLDIQRALDCFCYRYAYTHCSLVSSCGTCNGTVCALKNIYSKWFPISLADVIESARAVWCISSGQQRIDFLVFISIATHQFGLFAQSHMRLWHEPYVVWCWCLTIGCVHHLIQFAAVELQLIPPTDGGFVLRNQITDFNSNALANGFDCKSQVAIQTKLLASRLACLVVCVFDVCKLTFGGDVRANSQTFNYLKLSANDSAGHVRAVCVFSQCFNRIYSKFRLIRTSGRWWPNSNILIRLVCFQFQSEPSLSFDVRMSYSYAAASIKFSS